MHGVPRQRRLGFSATVAVILGVVLLTLGYLAGHGGWIYKSRTWLASTVRRAPKKAQRVAVRRSELVTAYHVLDIARVPLSRAFQLEEVGGHIVFATRYGQLGALIGNRAISLPVDIPIGLEALRADKVEDNPAFDVTEIHVTDLLSIHTGGDQYVLYAAGLLYDKACFYIQIVRIGMRADQDTVALTGKAWEPVFRTRDCRRLEGGVLVRGSQSGGRMVQLDPHTILLSVGAIGNEERVATLDPKSDFGTVITVPLDGRAPQTFARGFRNPQGLLVTRSGQIWETEHGPEGGDELNLLVSGRDYGWPFVTYGMQYGGRPTPWPFNPKVASHEGYEAPKFAWIPSIGVSNLVQPNPEEFPHWANHLAIASLRAMTLHLVRIEGDRAVLVEPLPFHARIRDVINLADGRLALATDLGDVYLLGNADNQHTGRWRPDSVDVSALAPLVPEAGLDASPLREAATQFVEKCGGCHPVFGKAGAAPALGGVIGRRVGSDTSYRYSRALTGRTETWTVARLRQWINSPRSVFPGTAMPDPYIDFDVDGVIRYLQQQKPTTPAK
ncbi:MAG TPA: PQQ-dependent sugar dehydrogenase [Gemmatimonadaceae bacterium]|nr:PQQ-dependent sugar dehydrogenase [Gemmatimonadaceae bacterium]